MQRVGKDGGELDGEWMMTVDDERGMVKEVEGVRNLCKRDFELHEGKNFGLYCGSSVDDSGGSGGVDGSGGSGVFRRMFLVCGGGELLTSFFNGGR